MKITDKFPGNASGMKIREWEKMKSTVADCTAQRQRVNVNTTVGFASLQPRGLPTRVKCAHPPCCNI